MNSRLIYPVLVCAMLGCGSSKPDESDQGKNEASRLDSQSKSDVNTQDKSSLHTQARKSTDSQNTGDINTREQNNADKEKIVPRLLMAEWHAQLLLSLKGQAGGIVLDRVEHAQGMVGGNSNDLLQPAAEAQILAKVLALVDGVPVVFVNKSDVARIQTVTSSANRMTFSSKSKYSDATSILRAAIDHAHGENADGNLSSMLNSSPNAFSAARLGLKISYVEFVLDKAKLISQLNKRSSFPYATPLATERFAEDIGETEMQFNNTVVQETVDAYVNYAVYRRRVAEDAGVRKALQEMESALMPIFDSPMQKKRRAAATELLVKNEEKSKLLDSRKRLLAMIVIALDKHPNWREQL